MSTYAVLYTKNLRDRQFDLPGILDIFDEYEMVESEFRGSKNDAFHTFQGEVWSPKGEARFLIQALGLSHTSMSVGDVLIDLDTYEALYVDRVGFQTLYYSAGQVMSALQYLQLKRIKAIQGVNFKEVFHKEEE